MRIRLQGGPLDGKHMHPPGIPHSVTVPLVSFRGGPVVDEVDGWDLPLRYEKSRVDLADRAIVYSLA